MRAVITVSAKRSARQACSHPQTSHAIVMPLQDCKKAVALLFRMLQRGARTRDIMTREAFENATTIMYAAKLRTAAMYCNI